MSLFDEMQAGFQEANDSLVEMKAQQPFTYKGEVYTGVASRVNTRDQMREAGYIGDYDTAIVLMKSDTSEAFGIGKEILYLDNKYTIEHIDVTSVHYKLFLKQRK